MRYLGFELRHELHLDRRVQRQLSDAHGRAGVQPGLSEDLAYKLGGPVDDLRLGVEARCRGDEAGHLYEAPYPVQASGLSRGGGEGVQGAEPGGGVGIFDRDGVTDLAGLAELTVLKGELTGGEDQCSGAGGRYVRAAGLWNGGQLEAKFAEARLRGGGHLAQGLLVLGR